MKKQAREFKTKTMPAWTKGIEGRTVTGITSVMGNVDDGGDRIIQGAYQKTISENARRFRHLWQHGADGWDYGVTPPIAAIRSIKEVGRDALPQAVLDYAPDATGGLEVSREYLATPRGDEILEAYKAGIALEMSIGYEVIQYRRVEAEHRVTANHYWDLIEIKLFDTSDVNWGMNSATVGSKNFERRLELLVERMKQLRSELPADKVDDFSAQLLELREEFQWWEQPAVDPALPTKAESRAEPTIERISLTPSLMSLRQLEVELLT